jgi:hypothetical protein
LIFFWRTSFQILSARAPEWSLFGLFAPGFQNEMQTEKAGEKGNISFGGLVFE